MARTTRQEIGAWGEALAAQFLEQNGYVILEKNYSVRGGELDIIAWHTKVHFGKTLCFIEVKTRQANDGSAERSVDWKKRQHLERAAKVYCIEHHIQTDRTPVQFEQVSVVYTSVNETPVIRWYELPAS